MQKEYKIILHNDKMFIFKYVLYILHVYYYIGYMHIVCILDIYLLYVSKRLYPRAFTLSASEEGLLGALLTAMCCFHKLFLRTTDFRPLLRVQEGEPGSLSLQHVNESQQTVRRKRLGPMGLEGPWELPQAKSCLWMKLVDACSTAYKAVRKVIPGLKA